MSVANPPPPLGKDWKPWGERLMRLLQLQETNYSFITADSKATQDGIIMWDEAQDCPVVSKNGAWIRIKLDP
jgi:predicted mannosyl-3-phosphoglycerate phosphatase (HAD superfamily)